MLSINSIRSFALSLPGTTEEPHFDKISFRVNGKIFATYDEKTKRASLKLSEIDQDVFSAVDRTIIFPVDNKWGKQGWTIVELSRVSRSLFMDALRAAYGEVAPSKLVSQIDNTSKPASKASLRTCKNGHQYYKTSDCPTCPVCEKNTAPIVGFLSTLSAPARRALQNEGITTLKKLSSYTESELLKLHGVGKTSIPKLRTALEEKGLRFKA